MRADPEPDEIRWTRIEIDNAIDNFIMFPSHAKELNTIHFMKKDWIRRGTEQNIELAVNQLSQAPTAIFPESDFARWYQESSDNDK